MNENEMLVDTTVENEQATEKSETMSAVKGIALCTAAGAVGVLIAETTFRVGKKLWNWAKAKVASHKASKEEAVEAEEETK